MESVDTIYLSLRPGVIPSTPQPHLSSVTNKSTPATTGLTGPTGGMWERAEPDGPSGSPEPYKKLSRTVRDAMTSTSTTPLGRYRVSIERCKTRALTPNEIRAEADAFIELLRGVYLAALGQSDRKKGWTPEKKAAMVAKMLATRKERGIDWPRGDGHWTRRLGYKPKAGGLW
jgi:hypothetical protein